MFNIIMVILSTWLIRGDLYFRRYFVEEMQYISFV